MVRSVFGGAGAAAVLGVLMSFEVAVIIVSVVVGVLVLSMVESVVGGDGAAAMLGVLMMFEFFVFIALVVVGVIVPSVVKNRGWCSRSGGVAWCTDVD